MRQVQRVGLWSAIGLLCAGLLSLVGCGGTDDGGDAAARVSRVAVQILPADQVSRNTLRQAAVSGQPRAVPTDPSDPAFVSRIDIRVEGEGISTPITQTITLTAAQQELVTTSLEVPSGQDRHIIISAFNANGDQTFGGETTADLLEPTVTVRITLSRVLVPEAVDPADLANKAFAFEDSDAFGVSGEVTLSFNTFTEDTGSFTLTADGLTASGTMTIISSATVNTRCRFEVDTSNFPPGSGPQAEQTLRMVPCAVDALDGNLILRNANTANTSTSDPPVAIAGINIDITVRDVRTNEFLAGTIVTINGVSNTTDTNGAVTFTNVAVGKAAIAASHNDYLTHAFDYTIRLDFKGLNLFIYPRTEATVDTDSDGLPDAVETNRRIFLSPRNTGTDPNNKDTDEDALTDGAEILVERVLVENQRSSRK
jgi:hypothetical protein